MIFERPILLQNGFATFNGSASPTTGNWLSIILAVVSPTSRGSVTLTSSDPFENPIIDPNLLSTAEDLSMMVQAIRDAQKLVSASAFEGFILSQVDPSPNATSDDELESFARQQTTTVYHPVGTVQMGREDGTSPLTPQLRVRGTVGLRVVDASIFVRTWGQSMSRTDVVPFSALHPFCAPSSCRLRNSRTCRKPHQTDLGPVLKSERHCEIAVYL